jgi:adenosylcobinamide kinase/adenosylcobinamide-phosphate guanylyltransferase
VLALLYGGSACGKSAMAEDICTGLGGKTLYVATMRPWGNDAQERIARHRALRADKGFDTLEHYQALQNLHLSKQYDTLLLECVGNLVANTLFEDQKPPHQVVDEVLKGTVFLLERVPHLVFVTNDIFSDGVVYPKETSLYQSCIGQINQELSQLADVVMEVVCGLAIYHKGGGVLP